MTDTVRATLPAMVRPFIEAQLPAWLEPSWFGSGDQALALAPGARIGWFDMYDKRAMAAAIVAAGEMRWLNSIFAGVDALPLQDLRARRVWVTNGAGINAVTIAEYVLMGMLVIAKGYRTVVRAQDRHEWLKDAPGKLELCASRALVIGYGAIGRLVEQRLKGFQVDVTVVRRHADKAGNMLGPGQWRARLGEFDWVILAVPGTPETDGMIGAAELAAMKPTAVLLNVARGSVVEQAALVDALRAGRIAAAFLDVTDPEPLPAGHPLWSLDTAHISMHLSGRSQTRMFERAGQRFLDNLARFHAGAPLQFQVDLERGY